MTPAKNTKKKTKRKKAKRKPVQAKRESYLLPARSEQEQTAGPLPDWLRAAYAYAA